MTNVKNLSKIYRLAREGGGIGRRVRLRGVWLSVWVQVPSFTPNKKGCTKVASFFLFIGHLMGLERVGIGNL